MYKVIAGGVPPVDISPDGRIWIVLVKQMVLPPPLNQTVWIV